MSVPRTAIESGFDRNRREFVKLATGSLIGASVLPHFAFGSSPEEDEPLVFDASAPKVPVVQATFAGAVSGNRVHRPICGELLNASLQRLMGVGSVKEAWQGLFSPDDVVGIKFNRSGQADLGTTPVLGRLIVESLLEAGWPPKRIVCIEAPAAIEEEFGTNPARTGYDDGPTDFGSGRDELASVLGQVTALINVPFLKTHNIAGLSGCLKNLSHGLIKHPARYHSGGCNPFVADIVALPAIRKKLKLCIVDALRVVFQGGPAPDETNVANANTLIVSRDPVSADAIGLGLINAIRKPLDLSRIPRDEEYLPQTAQAHRRGLGMAVLRGIEHIRLHQ